MTVFCSIEIERGFTVFLGTLGSCERNSIFVDSTSGKGVSLIYYWLARGAELLDHILNFKYRLGWVGKGTRHYYQLV